MQNLRLSTAQVKFHQICTFVDSFCWKYIKFQLKNYKRVMSHDTEESCKIWRKNDLSFQKWQDFGEFWFEHLQVSKIWTLIGPFRANYITFDLKKVQRSYLSWHWRFMQNLRKNWRVVWKMTWGIWQIFTSAYKSQNWDFYWVLLSKVENVWA